MYGQPPEYSICYLSDWTPTKVVEPVVVRPQHLAYSADMEDWQLGVVHFWNTCVDNPEDVLSKIILKDGPIVYLAYALDLTMKVDNELPNKIKAILDANKSMVDKAKKNAKLEGWFVGQVMASNRNVDPKTVAVLVHELIKK